MLGDFLSTLPLWQGLGVCLAVMTLVTSAGWALMHVLRSYWELEEEDEF